MEVTKNYRHQRTSHNENKINQKKESKHVVNPLRPKTVENKVELNENGAKRKETAHESGYPFVEVQRLGRDLTWDLVGFAGRIKGRVTESGKRTRDTEWDRDQEPHHNESHECAKGYGGRGLIVDQEKVERY
jgi:hypothetical protein